MKWLVVFTICASAGLGQQTKSEKRGKELVDQTVQALGGDRFLNMQDRVESGRAYSFYREQISGLSIAKIYTRYVTVAPDKTGSEVAQREREAFGVKEESAVMFNESGGWEISWRGAKDLPKDRVDRYRESTLRNVLYIFRKRLKEPGIIFEARGTDIVDFQPVDLLDITDSENRVVQVSLSQTSHLPVRQVYRHINPEDHRPDEEVTIFARYRDVGGGVQWPLQMRRERNGEKVYEIYSETVEINQDLTDDLFTVPSGKDEPPPKQKKKK